jgi:bacterioferritin-associated ferredoxin
MQLTIIRIYIYDRDRPMVIGLVQGLIMYVCICKAVTDSAIRAAVGEGASSLRELSARTGCSTQCGRCVQTVREILDTALVEQGAPKSKVELEVVAGI